MQRVFVFLLLFVSFFSTVCCADVNDYDNRYYVNSETWSQEPYNKFVHFEAGHKFMGVFWTEYTCSAQYVAPNLILSAGHCVGDKKQLYKAINYKNEKFDLVLAYTDYTGEEEHGVNDWAVWLVKDPKFFSDTFFEIETITKQTDFINAGWGWMRILTDEEIRGIFELMSWLYDESGSNMSTSQISEKIDKDMKSLGMEPIRDEQDRLKASHCHSIEPEDCNEIKNELNKKEQERDKLYNEFAKCIPAECKEKMQESFQSYYDCIPQDCKNKHIQANNIADETSELSARYEDCNFHSHESLYPYVIENSCRTWPGNSGGGYVSQKGSLYGVCSFGTNMNGKAGFLEKRGFMASSLQFESKIRELRETYSTANTPRQNLKKIPKYKGVIKKADDDMQNESLAVSDDHEIIEEEEYTEEEMKERINSLKQELSENETDLLDLLKQSKDFGLERKLQLLNKLTAQSVKSDRVAELQQKYEEAKANEQSLANRTLTALSVAAAGIGGMELAMGLAEQKADKEADMDMTAYIETMRCTYGDGKQVKAGPEEIELPGGNDETLMKLRNEYFALASDLKERKEALGMKPGIESEIVMDKSQMGLYDDENIGIESGAYESLYRAKMLESETDQAKIDENKEASKKRVIAGGVLSGVGVVGGMVGNSMINGKLGEMIKENKNKKSVSNTNKSVINKLKAGLKSTGMTNVDKLDFSNLDLSSMSGVIDKIDFTSMSDLKGKNATEILNTSNSGSFTSSFGNILGSKNSSLFN